MRHKLRELRDRVNQAAGGSERLDDAICAALHYAEPNWRPQAESAKQAWPGAAPGVINYRDSDIDAIRSWPSVALTYSLGATLALIDQLLNRRNPDPSTVVSLQWRGTRGWHYQARIRWCSAEWFGCAQTPPLACLSALLSILIAVEDGRLAGDDHPPVAPQASDAEYIE
jgi:hypothetical protein